MIGRAIKSPDQKIPLVKEWIQNCEHNHPQCATSPVKLPSRVIDVGALNTQEPRLKITTEGEIAHYMTLSHCWGRKPVIRTTKATLQSHLTSLPLASLPKTFREAITITRELGIKYLWIDSLCIIQDDAGDWEKESAVMGQIYACSYLTIAASASKDSSGGCFLSRPPPDNQCKIKCTLSSGEISHVFLRPKTKGFHDLDASFLQTRAWVAQERLLSPRSLHFDTDQIMWECKTDRLTEDGIPVDVDLDSRQSTHWDGRFQVSYPFTPEGSSLTREFVWDWYEMLENYTTRNLTNGEDKLPALSGIASVMVKRTNDQYVAGLWENNINYGLLWRRIGKAPWLEKPERYRAPTWSWAAFDGAVIWPDDSSLNSSLNPFKPMLEDVSLEIIPLGLDPNGRLAFGAATTTGRLKIISPRVDPESEGYIVYPEDGAGQDHIWDGEESVGWVNYDEQFEKTAGERYALQMTECIHPKKTLCHCLILESTGKEGQFKRVGLGCTGGGEVRLGWFENAKKRRIHII